MTRNKPKNTTSIDYYPVISKSITKDMTVRECLQYDEQETDEVGQYYVLF